MPPEASDLVYLSREPLNAELRPERIRDATTPVGQHYVRDHFAIPAPPKYVEVGGLVAKPTRVTLDEIRALPPRRLLVTLECAGNGRAYLDPPAPGEQWHLGAIGTAEWTGVPLRALLERAGPESGAVEVQFVGADRGTPKDLGREIAYERSLPLRDAMSEDVLIAYAMNGEPLAPEHGAPLRLVVAGWYGMASVKWLSRIELVDKPFAGFFQRDRYVIDAEPLRTIAPRAIITDPADGARVARGPLRIRGKAWSGRAPIDLVEVSSDGGYSWHRAELGATMSQYAWRDWAITLPTGELSQLSLLAYATTTEGEQQPTSQRRSTLGYSNNAARPVHVVVA